MKKYSLGEWLQVWFEVYKQPNLAPNSVRNIEQVIRLHIPAWLKNMSLKDIKPLDIDRAIAQINGGRTKKYTRQILNNCIQKACNLGYLSCNVVSMSEAVKYSKKKSKALTMREQTQFLKDIENSRYKNLFMFYLLTGVRCSEALSITIAEIDEEEKLIEIKGTKTEESNRQIFYTPAVRLVVEEQWKQNEREKKEGKLPDDEGRLFPYNRVTVSRAFKRYCPAHHLHELRHTFITRCAENGINVTVCQALVGHTTAEMTLNVYTHVMDEYKRKEAEKYTIYPKIYQET